VISGTIGRRGLLAAAAMLFAGAVSAAALVAGSTASAQCGQIVAAFARAAVRARQRLGACSTAVRRLLRRLLARWPGRLGPAVAPLLLVPGAMKRGSTIRTMLGSLLNGMLDRAGVFRRVLVGAM